MSWYHRLLGIPDRIAEQERAKSTREIESRAARAEVAIRKVDRVVHEYEQAERRRLNQDL